jgi:hypothetical protein
MQLSISQSKQFQEDCKRYKDAIEKVSDPQFKAEMEDLLRRLIFEVRSMDNLHSDMLTNSNAASKVKDSRAALTSIRKDLEKRVASLSV